MAESKFPTLPTMFKRIDAALTTPGKVRKGLYVVWVLIQDMIRFDLGKQASAMAYVTLLSLVPSLVAVFCVISLFMPLVGKDSVLLDHLRGFILENLAAGSGQAVVTKLDEMLRGLSLSKIGWSSFAGVLVTLILLLRQIEEALNSIWFVRKARNLISRFVYFWTFLTLGMLILGIVVGAVASMNLSHYFNVNAAVPKDSALVTGILAWVGGFIFFFFTYKVVPNCFVRARHAAVGAAVSSLILLQGGRLYALFVKGATNYQTLYGALAALPLFLTWLYICWIIILLGAVIAWRMEQGFPTVKDEEALDNATNPLDQLRNNQIQAALPLISLLAINQRFLSGAGRGLTPHSLATSLRLPLVWICEAIEALQAMGYVVATSASSEAAASIGDADTTENEAFFPAFPPASVSVSRLQKDLHGPMETWLGNWQHELPVDIKKALQAFINQNNQTNLEEIITHVTIS